MMPEHDERDGLISGDSMDLNHRVRPVTLSEMPAVIALYDQYDKPKSPSPDSETIGTIFKQLHSAGGCVFGAFTDDHLIGSCTFHLCANFSWSGRPFAMVENVIVDRDHRQLGIGRQLLHAATEKARAMDCYKVALMTGAMGPETHAFYRSAGFIGDKTGYQIRFDDHV